MAVFSDGDAPSALLLDSGFDCFCVDGFCAGVCCGGEALEGVCDAGTLEKNPSSEDCLPALLGILSVGNEGCAERPCEKAC